MNLLVFISTVGRWVAASNTGNAIRGLLPVVAILFSSGCQPSTPTLPASSAPATPEGVDTNSTTATPNVVSPASDEGDTQVPVAATTPAKVPRDTVQQGEGTGLPPSARRESGGAANTIEIVFEDIQLPIQADMVFRPFMLTDRVKELDGKRIRINGFMLPDSKTRGIQQFVLVKNTECKFGPGGQADHLVNVLMTDGVTAKFRDDAISVEGVLTINPFEGPDGNTWSIYDLACDRVETYRPRR